MVHSQLRSRMHVCAWGDRSFVHRCVLRHHRLSIGSGAGRCIHRADSPRKRYTSIRKVCVDSCTHLVPPFRSCLATFCLCENCDTRESSHNTDESFPDPRIEDSMRVQTSFPRRRRNSSAPQGRRFARDDKPGRVLPASAFCSPHCVLPLGTPTGHSHWALPLGTEVPSPTFGSADKSPRSGSARP